MTESPRPSFNPDIILGQREMQSCFLVNYGGATGTAFLFQDEQRAFFVTANHNLVQARVGDNLLFKYGTDWRAFPLTGIWHDPNGYDAGAFTVDNFVLSEIIPTKIGCFLLPGEPLKFLGFPHGLEGNFPGQGFATPLVRTAYFSGIIMIGGSEIMVLDGFNNPGFSGGPVYVTYEGETSLCGLISSYRPERSSHSRIYRRNDEGEEESLPDLYTKPNSGMIYALGLPQLGLFNAVDGSLRVG